MVEEDLAQVSDATPALRSPHRTHCLQHCTALRLPGTTRLAQWHWYAVCSIMGVPASCFVNVVSMCCHSARLCAGHHNRTRFSTVSMEPWSYSITGCCWGC
jgi:hypothetical protein